MNVNYSLISGLCFSLFFGLLVTIIQMINPRAELKSYPEGIKILVTPLTEKEKKRFKIGKIVVFPIIISLLIVDYFLRVDFQNYFHTFFHFLIVFSIWTLFDLIIMDWLVFCTLTPKYLVFKGTENNKEYKNYKFHLRGILFGIPFSVIFSLILTLLVSGIRLIS